MKIASPVSRLEFYKWRAQIEHDNKERSLFVSHLSNPVLVISIWGGGVRADSQEFFDGSILELFEQRLHKLMEVSAVNEKGDRLKEKG